MNYLTVTEDENGTGLQQILINDILYMQFDNPLYISVHTDAVKYFTVGTLRFWESAFDKAGMNFVRVDRGILINLDKIKAVDATYKLAYFDYPFTDTSKSCTMSYAGYKAISKRLAMGVPKITHAH